MLFTMLACYGCSTTSGSRPLVAISMESKANTLDGCVSCGCRLNGEQQPGVKEKWWLSFGLLLDDNGQDLQTVLPVNQCGRGSFEAVQTEFEQQVGVPYAVVDIATTATSQSGNEVSLGVELKHRILSGFAADGLPQYTHSEQSRSYFFQKDTDITLPLLIADAQDTERLGVHEVLVRLRATLLGVNPPRNYGIIVVQADVPGAEILLDGSFAGRTIENSPFVLANVPAGISEIRVRDYSAREASRQVTVRTGESSEILFDVLKLEKSEGILPGLKPIGKNPQGYQEHWREKDKAMVVEIPAGEFQMGNSQGEAHEKPVHQVHLSGFLIDKTEVTWRQISKFTEATGTRPPPEPLWGTPDNHPASLVNWREAQHYCEWVGGRLPTEAEWEKAARGSDGRIYQWGNQWDPLRCNAISGGPHRPESAGSFPNCYSPYGVLDLAGSMWEWAQDWYQPDYYTEGPSRDPLGPEVGKFNVVRGGGWMTQPRWLRTSYRFRLSPNSRRPDLGFRCVLELPEQ